MQAQLTMTNHQHANNAALQHTAATDTTKTVIIAQKHINQQPTAQEQHSAL